MICYSNHVVRLISADLCYHDACILSVSKCGRLISSKLYICLRTTSLENKIRNCNTVTKRRPIWLTLVMDRGSRTYILLERSRQNRRLVDS